MREATKDTFVKWFTSLLVVTIIVGGLVFAWRPYQRNKMLQHRRDELDRSIATRKAEIDKLRRYQDSFKTDRDFVEAIARKNKRVYPGELVFVFDEKGK